MKRPWNLVSQQVYSLATYVNCSFNMNICTYVTPLSLKPKLYGIALYNGTKTLDNIRSSKFCVLQVLGKSQTKLVRTLGKKSGRQYDKESYLVHCGVLKKWKGYPVLKESAALVLLERRLGYEMGDHQFYTFDVIASKSIYENGLLTTQHLIEGGLIL